MLNIELMSTPSLRNPCSETRDTWYSVLGEDGHLRQTEGHHWLVETP